MLTVATITLSPSIDYTIVVPRLVPEEKLRGEVVATEPGGGGIQVARGLRRFGMAVEAITVVGGSTGRALVALLKEEGLNLRAVWVSAPTRPSFTLHVDAEQTNYRIVGHSEPLREDEYLPTLTRLQEIEDLPPYVVLSGSMPPGVPPSLVDDIADVTAQRGSNLVVDTSGAALRAAAEHGVALIKPSLEELAGLVDPAVAAGGAVDTATFDVRAAARQILDGGVRSLVVSLAGLGCYVASDDGQEALLTAPQVTVSSTVGAGDSLVAGLVTGLSRGLPLVEASKLGVAAGSGTCRHPGSALFTDADLAELIPLVTVVRDPEVLPPPPT